MFANKRKSKPLKEKYGAHHKYEPFGCMPYYKANPTVYFWTKNLLLGNKFKGAITLVYCRKLNAGNKRCV